VRDPIFKKVEACAMGGPIFRYDGDNPSSSQFPPQFNRKWLIGDCVDGSYGFHLLTLDSAGESVTQDVKIFATFRTNTLTDLKQGPDGAVYYVNHGAGLDVIRYKGTCKDPSLHLETPTSLARMVVDGAGWLKMDASRIVVLSNGNHDIHLMNISGRTVESFHGEGPKEYPLSGLAPGLYLVRVESERGIAFEKFLR
jgi:hypothetical protein